MKSSSVMSDSVPNVTSGGIPATLRGNLLEVERADGHHQQQRPENERVVADAVDDERFLRGIRGRLRW